MEPRRRPGFFDAQVTVDLDGDGVSDAELGRMVCDHHRPGGGVERDVMWATRLRSGGAWRFTDVAVGGFEDGSPGDATEPYAFCPLEPPAPETEILPQASQLPTAATRSEGVASPR